MAMSFGWVVVRRAEPQHRMVDGFLREEICAPLGIRDLYQRLPADALPRYAENSYVQDPAPPPDLLNAIAAPCPANG